MWLMSVFLWLNRAMDRRDIFLPSDTTWLRKVLQVHENPKDPVLSQNIYLCPSMLHELALQHDIKASTFIQKQGDAVFIPVGCAHQVHFDLIFTTIDHVIKAYISNITSTIKIACDFISIEHLSTTIGLVSTFHQHRISKQSGDDVLQVYTTLLHAWFSLARFHELYSKHGVDFDGMDRSKLS